MSTVQIHFLPIGYWRVFDADYRDRVCQYILTLLEEEDWSYKQVPLEQTISKLEELEPRWGVARIHHLMYLFSALDIIGIWAVSPFANFLV